ncbi:MAG: hypothetical protein MKZ95_03095 [Pirellulales bacterium]|nr:hypothetical protein [Pirellulales bacterium]
MLSRWLPRYGLKCQIGCALGTAILVFVQGMGAVGEASDHLFRSPSTLDAHVPQHNLEWQATVIDFLGSSDLANDKNPRDTIPELQSQSKTSNPKTSDQASRVSPFRKWVAPKKSTAISEQPVAEPTPQADESRKPTEKVALRIRSSRRLPQRTPPQTQKKDSQPLPAKTQNKKQESPSEVAATIPSPTKKKVEPAPSPGDVDLEPLTNNQKNLRKKVRRVLTHYYNRPLNTRDRSPWEVMHGILAYEVHSKVLQGGPQGDPITAVGWLCFNQSCKRRSLMYVNDEGKLRVRVGPALQGHRGQLLAMLAQASVNRAYPMRVDEQDYVIADLIRMEMETCYPRTELTFKLIGLMHYLNSDTTWVNDQGMQWDIPRLISEEIRQPIRGAACGGTHRLSGLTLAYKTREKRGEPIDGEYLKAKKFVSRYQQYAYRLQNGDGSLSTEWFRGPGNEESIDRKFKTTGHILEWLLYAANEKQLHHWRTVKAVNYLANIMHNNRYKNWESGPLGHAIHALLLYNRLVFEPHDPPNTPTLAAKLRRSSEASMRR